MKINYYAYSIVIIAGFLFLGSCRKDKISPSQANTFIKYFGQNGNNIGGTVDQTTDGGYILIGTSDAYGNGNQIIVQKTDKYGNAMWMQVIGGPGNDTGSFVKITADGGYLIAAARAEKGNSAYTDANLIKLNSDGSVGFDSTYGYPNVNDYGTRAISTMDGGYMLIGTTDSTAFVGTHAFTPSKIFIAKTNASGMTSWTWKFGNANAANVGTSIQQLNDSIYFTSGSFVTDTSKNMLVTQGRYQFGGKDYNFISNISKSALPNPGNSEVISANDIILGNANNQYILGNCTSGIYLLNMLNGTTQLFYKIIGTAGLKAVAFSQTSDGGFVIAGNTINTSNGNADILIVRTDASGNVIWMKNYGGTGNDYGSFAKQTTDGGYIVSGTVQFGGDQTGANNVMALFKLNSNGDLE